MTTLTLALEKVDFLPPDRVTDDTSVLTLKTLVFEPLLKWDNGEARPGLFHRWTHSADGRDWRFFIRPDAVFHDGRPCTPADILAFIDGILVSVDTFGMKWSYARYLAATTFAEGPDNSILVRDPEPIADILDIFCEFFICRQAPDGSATLGTGPWRVTGFSRGVSATLARVGAGEGPDTLAVRAVPKAEDRYRLLKDGAVDAAHNLERIEHRFDPDPAFDWGRAVNTLSVMYYLNCAHGLFTAPEARLAANLAVDVEAIAREVFHGLAVPAATVVSPYHLGMAGSRLAPIPHDPDRARALFAAAGGGAVTLRTPTFMPERAPEISARVAGDLRRAGLDVTVETEPDRPEYARQIGRKQMGDLALFDSSPGSTYRVLDDKIAARRKAVWWQGYDDAETETLIRAANRAVTPPDRAAAYARCLARLNADPPWLYLVHPVELFAARPGVARLALDHKGVLAIA